MDNIVSLITEPFLFIFMQQAFAIVVLVALPTALLSCFLVLKGWSLMGDAVSHSVLPGVVIAYIIGIPYAIGASGRNAQWPRGSSAAIAVLKKTQYGIVFSSMFAQLVMLTKIESDVPIHPFW